MNKNVMRLLKKDFRLAMHPTVPLMLLSSAMVLIPNYPYSLPFFYTSMGIFFTCLLSRENRDVVYSLNLPVSKRDIVSSRLLFAVTVELCQLVLMTPFALLSQYCIGNVNAAGMDANIALFAEGFAVYGIFNIVFFLSYYSDVTRVGVAFIGSSVAIFFCIACDIIFSYTVPLFRDRLDTPDPSNLPAKLTFLGVSILFFVICCLICHTVSVHKFEKQDIC